MKILNMYDAAIRSICLARRALLDGDTNRAAIAVSQAQSILGALSRSFRSECGPILGGELEAMHGELMVALERGMEDGSVLRLEAVLDQLNEVRQFWGEAVERAAA